jgi:hypothetical protein
LPNRAGDVVIGAGESIGWEMRMTNRLPLAILLSALPTLALPTVAAAADPEFCKQYAQAALNQVRTGLSDPICGSVLRGARWSSEFSVHYELCLGAPPAAAAGERDARTRFLQTCNRR